MLTTRRSIFIVLLIFMIALATEGCLGTVPPAPTPTPQPTPDPATLMPEEVVTAFWNAIDSGRYSDAYQFAYHEQNVSQEEWVRDRLATYGANGSHIEIYDFNLTESFPLAPGTFEGNFSAVQVVLVDTELSYQGNNRSGTVQFPVVKTESGWKIYGDY
ncbi:hypothetical protein [Methanocella sp. MCL-LM]|uniref:hypothetical protein n=1 Tax=Methanocella sp. MCL-LM TaxID=3412035 RepID=UPI003C78ECD2